RSGSRHGVEAVAEREERVGGAGSAVSPGAGFLGSYLDGVDPALLAGADADGDPVFHEDDGVRRRAGADDLGYGQVLDRKSRRVLFRSAAPEAATASRPSRNGKNASEAQAAP